MKKVNQRKKTLISIGGRSYGFIIDKSYVDNGDLSVGKEYDLELTELEESPQE